MATLLKYKKGLKRPTLAWNEFAIRCNGNDDDDDDDDGNDDDVCYICEGSVDNMTLSKLNFLPSTITWF